MIKASGSSEPYATEFTNGKHQAAADASLAKGGQETGFGPHELLEAASATCMSIWLRMCAQKLNLALREARVTVELNRSNPDEAVFEYDIRLEGDLTPEAGKQLREMAHTCPVHQTLARRIVFRDTPE